MHNETVENTISLFFKKRFKNTFFSRFFALIIYYSKNYATGIMDESY
jgi:hypothetical protein